MTTLDTITNSNHNPWVMLFNHRKDASEFTLGQTIVCDIQTATKPISEPFRPTKGTDQQSYGSANLRIGEPMDRWSYRSAELQIGGDQGSDCLFHLK